MNNIINSFLRAAKNPKLIIWRLKTRLIPTIIIKFKLIFKSFFLSHSERGKIVMFHIGRSGSTVLGDILSQDNEIYWDGEIFKQYTNNLDRNWVDYFYKQRQPLSGKDRFYGFEIKFFHIDKLGKSLSDFIDKLKTMGFNHFIILERKNYLRKITSSVLASQTGRWHNAPGEKSKPSSVTLNVNSINIDDKALPLMEYLDKYTNQFTKLRELLAQNETLWLTYEDEIETDPHIAYEKICNYLNIEEKDIEVRFNKTNPFPLPKLIENFEEVSLLLKDSPYEWMLESNEHGK